MHSAELNKLSNDHICSISDCILFGIYALTTFAFIPLFTAIMMKLRKNYPHIYSDIKCKLLTLFLVFILFLTARLYLYADIKKLKKIFENPNIYGVIPFYFSEIVITGALSYVLFAVSKMENNSTTMQGRKSLSAGLISGIHHVNGEDATLAFSQIDQ